MASAWQQDLTALLNQMLEWNQEEGSPWKDRLDESLIGAMGHSLGGYTVLGMAGGWPAWQEPRLRAVVLFSPFAQPFSGQASLARIRIPVMLQGGTRDFGITPSLPPIYKDLGGSKVLLILKDETHFGWTNFASRNQTTTECIAEGNPELILKYTVAFFDQHLRKLDRSQLLEKTNPRFEFYNYVTARK